MSCPRLGFFLCLLFLEGWAPAQEADMPFTASERILVMAPHPDDEILCCGGILQKAVQAHWPIKIVFFTYGDYNKWAFTVYRHHPVFRPKAMRAMGEIRREEALAAAKTLGIGPEDLLFLGYPDYETIDIWNGHWGPAIAFESTHTRVQAVPYSTAFRSGSPYKGEEIIHDLEAIVKDFRPTKIILPHPADQMLDHRSLYLFTRAALWDLGQAGSPEIYTYLVHYPPWPKPRGLHLSQALAPPEALNGPNLWLKVFLTPDEERKKHEALEKHQTERGYSDRFLTSFVKSNELFGVDSQVNRSENKDVQAAVEGSEMVLTGNLSPAFAESSQVAVAAFGWRGDIPFEKMPKISIIFRGDRFNVFDQGQAVQREGVRLSRDHRAFTIRLPLANLGRPRRILLAIQAPARRPFDWNSWRILELPESYPDR